MATFSPLLSLRMDLYRMTIKIGDPLIVHWDTRRLGVHWKSIGFLCSADNSGLCLTDSERSLRAHRWIWRGTITGIERLGGTLYGNDMRLCNRCGAAR